MAGVDVFGDARADDRFVLAHHIQIVVAHLRGDFVADVYELTERWVIVRAVTVVFERGDKLFRAPTINFVGGRKIGGRNVDDGCVRRGELVLFGEGGSVNFFRHIECFTARLREAGDFFEPGGSGSFYVYARVVFFDDFSNDWINRKLVASGVEAQFQVLRQTEFLNRFAEYFHIGFELSGKLRDIADVFDAFIEAPGKARSDGLNGNAFGGEESEHVEQFVGQLRLVGFVHGDFSDKRTLAFDFDDAAIDSTRFCGGGFEAFA